MSEEILANVTPHETRIALIENGLLQEVHIQRSTNSGVVGNIYKGRVQRVLPGMQAAFVEIGLARTAFLHVADMARSANSEPDTVPDIRSLLREGDTLLVQVLKDPISSKGARLTTELSLASRHLVMLPNGRNIGISARIEDPLERERLRALIETARATAAPAQGGAAAPHGYIVRTAGEGAAAAALTRDMQFLGKLWAFVEAQASSAPEGTMVYGDLPLVLRMLRDLIGTEVERVRIDNLDSWQQVIKFGERFNPESTSKIELYEGDTPIFDLYGAEEELQKALQPRVPLKSGGYLIIEQTEAMVTIDVNTGGFVGSRNPEETIFKTNLEAAQAIARQLRLRNLGGIIVLDFIDMKSEEHREQVLRALLRHLAYDPAKSFVTGFSPLSLVEMTRKRTRESLEHMLCEPCQQCSGRGRIKTAETVCFEIMREVQRSAHQFEARELMILACPDVIDTLLDELSPAMAELENTIGRPIKLQAESLYPQESFDVVLV